MAVIVSGIISGLNASDADIIASAEKKLALKPSDVKLAGIHKTSLDARDNSAIKKVSSVWLETENKAAEKRLCDKYKFCAEANAAEDAFPTRCGVNSLDGRVVIAGFGPAGMFAALTLAEYGFKPLVTERGGCIDERVKAVNGFWSGGEFDVNTNVQFGEGGAGTFSDGKLTTRIKDPLCRRVLERFHEFGAPDEILVKAKPHIGTDKLREIVRQIRLRIIELGGEVRFNTRLTDFTLGRDGKISDVTLNGNEIIPCAALITAIGHSARDTFEMLLEKGVFIEPKPFSVGARIEHRQDEVNRSLYGGLWDNPSLPKGEYQLSRRLGERGVYTFCMCPGGTVVPAQSEAETVVTNGMSEFARDGDNANSALVVSVTPEDFGKNALDGVEFARAIEKKAFVLGGGGYKAPACTVGSFLDGKCGLDGADVSPTYARGFCECDFRGLFPKFVTDMMALGLRDFGGKMKCFSDRNAVMTAPETRTSSPVRITRGEDFCSISARGLYPCGEGAGYAGGIMSAAVDGIRTAIKIIENYSP